MKYHLIIGNQSWLSENLEELEPILYHQWYIGGVVTEVEKPVTFEEFVNSKKRFKTEDFDIGSEYKYCYIYLPEQLAGFIEIVEDLTDEGEDK